MKKLLAGILGSVMLAGVAMPAGAAIITTPVQTLNFGTHLTEFDSDNAAQTYATQIFSLFDTNLGTLLSVSIRATYQESSNISVTNNGATTATGSVNSRSILYVDANDSAQDAVFQSLLAPVTAIGTTANFGTPRSGTTGIGASETRNFTSDSGLVDTGYKIDTTAQEIAAFAAAGGGDGFAIANTYTTTNLNATGGNPAYVQSTYGTPTYYIYYSYDDSSVSAVPESATWAMMLAGFGLVGYGMRRKGIASVFG